MGPIGGEKLPESEGTGREMAEARTTQQCVAGEGECCGDKIVDNFLPILGNAFASLSAEPNEGKFGTNEHRKHGIEAVVSVPG